MAETVLGTTLCNRVPATRIVTVIVMVIIVIVLVINSNSNGNGNLPKKGISTLFRACRVSRG